MQTPTRPSPSPPQTFDSGASVSYLKRGNAGFFAVSSAVFLHPSAAVASAALAGNKESLAAFGLLAPVSAPTIGEESYAVFQSVRGQYLVSWRRCNYLFTIDVQSVASVGPAVVLARVVDAAALGK